MQDFKKLVVWQLAHRLALNVDASCDPRVCSRRPGFRSQTVRTADSVATNISEGASKSSPEFARYLDIALAAANELENHLIRGRDSRLIPIGRSNRLIDATDHVRRKLILLIRKVRGWGP